MPAQRIAVAEAIYAYTLGAAYASRAADRMGTSASANWRISRFFSSNFLEAPADQIAGAHVLLTLVDGRVAEEGGLSNSP